jgi:hypothetical protein
MSNFSGLALSRTEMKGVKGGCWATYAYSNGANHVVAYGWGSCGKNSHCYNYSC